MSSKFDYSPPKTTAQHSLKSTKHIFTHCKKIFECSKDGRIMAFLHVRLSTLYNKIGPQCVLGILCLVLFLSDRMLFSNVSIWELNCYK